MNDESAFSKPLAVPSGRFVRAARFGTMAGGLAGALAVDGARRWVAGDRPEMRELILTPANLRRLTDELARMRGAAMKVGQLISMDAGDMLPPELGDILARLRADADHMPPAQLRRVLDGAWGRGWQRRFSRFEARPIAAASIGQVHRAVLPDGRAVAIKVQYPGIRRAIDSDVANVGTFVRLSGLLPPGMDIAPLLDEAKRQLREEADYVREGAQLAQFGALLDGVPGLAVPRLEADLTTEDVLVMGFLPGHKVEALAEAEPAERDRVMVVLLELLFRELFEFGLMQTDPNFANYRYDPETGRVILLDFGATRPVPGWVAEGYRALLRAGIAGDGPGMEAAARALGFVGPDTEARHVAAVTSMVHTAFRPLREGGHFAFGDEALAAEMRAHGMAMAGDRTFTHIPPIDTLFVQRKIAGIALLGRTLRARVDLRALAEAALAD